MDKPLLLDRIVLEFNTFSARRETCFQSECHMESKMTPTTAHKKANIAGLELRAVCHIMPQQPGLFPGRIYILCPGKQYMIVTKIPKFHPKLTLTNNNDGVPTTARQVWNMMQWSKYWPRPWGTNIRAMGPLGRCHCQTPITAITPGKDMVVWGNKRFRSLNSLTPSWPVIATRITAPLL